MEPPAIAGAAGFQMATSLNPKPLGAVSQGFSGKPADRDHAHSALNIEQVLFSLSAANMNSTADQAFTKAWSFTNFIITRVRVVGGSTSLTTAQGGLYTSAGKAGSAIIAAAQAYTALTGAGKGMDATLALLDQISAAPILSLTTAQGTAGTAAFYVIGIPLS